MLRGRKEEVGVEGEGKCLRAGLFHLLLLSVMRQRNFNHQAAKAAVF